MGTKFTTFALFYFVFEGIFQVQAPPGAYIRRDGLTEGFLLYNFFWGGLIFGGSYAWRGLFSEFYGNICRHLKRNFGSPRGHVISSISSKNGLIVSNILDHLPIFSAAFGDDLH